MSCIMYYAIEGEPSLVNRLAKRIKPGSVFLKANWDVALDCGNVKMGAEVVFKNEDGELIATLCMPLDNVNNLVIVKLNALWRALTLYGEIWLSNVIFERDALVVIKDIQMQEPNYSWFGQIIEDIKSVFKERQSWKLQYTPRESNVNVVAHQVAKLALQGEDERIWLEEGPTVIDGYVQFDQRCIE